MNELVYKNKILRIDGKYNNKSFVVCIETWIPTKPCVCCATIYWKSTKLTKKEKSEVLNLITREHKIDTTRWIEGNPNIFFSLCFRKRRTLKALAKEKQT